MSFSISTAAATLAAQAHYGAIQVTSSGVVDSPQTVQVYTSSQAPLTFQASSDSPRLLFKPGFRLDVDRIAGIVERFNRPERTLVRRLSRERELRPRATTCSPTQTGLVNSFAEPAAWPTPLTKLLVDNCGNPVTNGQVAATLSNGDPPPALAATGTTPGFYSATWTLRNTSVQVTIAGSAAGPHPNQRLE